MNDVPLLLMKPICVQVHQLPHAVRALGRATGVETQPNVRAERKQATPVSD